MTGTLADAHLHLFSQGFPSTRGRPVLLGRSEVAEYEALREAHGIGAGLVVGYEAEGIDPQNNRYIRGLAAERSWMATLAYVPCYPAPGCDRIDAFFASGHVGLAIYLPDGTAAASFAEWPAEIWQLLDERNAIVSLNAGPEGVRGIASRVRTSAGCSFLFSHLGLPGRYPTAPSLAEAAARLQPLLDLADCPSVRIKISGLYAVSDPPQAYPHNAARPFVELLLDRFGPRRCLWGSDFSPALEFVAFAETATVLWLDRLRRDEREQVMGRNLLELLGRGGDG